MPTAGLPPRLLELSNGPTLAFKDMAMQLLGNLFEYVLAKRGETINILGATSGDTGSAAEYAMRGKHGVRVFMLSPHGKHERLPARADVFAAGRQHLQHRRHRHVRRCPGHREGGFQRSRLQGQAQDRCSEFDQLGRGSRRRSCITSRATSRPPTSNDEQVAFCVPSGNFGNICAGHIARQMGLPVAKLILATNENDVLDEFFRSGVYRPRKAAETHVTSSPSMDISKASNFERFVFDLVGRDPSQGGARCGPRSTPGGAFDLSGTDEFARIGAFGFVSGASSHADRLATIRKVYERYGVMIDTHTADGVKVAWERAADVPAGVPVLVLETALPVKFAETIVEALGREPERPADLEGIEKLPQRVEVMAPDADAIKRFIAQRT
jgi:threonine synthase